MQATAGTLHSRADGVNPHSAGTGPAGLIRSLGISRRDPIIENYTERDAVTVARPSASNLFITNGGDEYLRRWNEEKDIYPGLSAGIDPDTRRSFRFDPPERYRGVYINNYTVQNRKKYESLLNKADLHGINTLVIDVQPKAPSARFMEYARKKGYYLIARVVVFDGGLKVFPPSPESLRSVFESAEGAVRSGFAEIQLDYIRFADHDGIRADLRGRYRMIDAILTGMTRRLNPLGVRVGADVFGRVAFNRDDRIGQKLENFAAHMDTIYPMLYPSHFYGQPEMIGDPYKAVYLGTKNCKDRIGHKSRIVSYVQGFGMSVSQSGLSLEKYIRRQIDAVEDAGGDGYIVWSPGNRYEALFRVLSRSAINTAIR